MMRDNMEYCVTETERAKQISVKWSVIYYIPYVGSSFSANIIFNLNNWSFRL